jgi:hypothetical protein
VWQDLASIAPGGGLAGSVIGLLVWFQRVGREDRREYREALAATRAEFETRLKEEHARVLEIDMHAQLEADEARKRIDTLTAALDAERARARHAELDLEGAKIKMGHLRLRLKIAKGEDVDWDDD